MGSVGVRNMLDYDASIQRLISQVTLIHSSTWSPTPKKTKLKSLAADLVEMANLLQEEYWADLEDAFDAGLIEWDAHSYRVVPESSNIGRYKNLTWELNELADLASNKADDLPNPRKKTASSYAAMGLLHIMYETGMDKPKLYDSGLSVQELKKICDASGITLSVERIRGILKGALEKFDPLMGDYDEFFVWSQ